MEVNYKEKERNFREFYTEKYEFYKSGANVYSNLIRALLIDEIPVDDVLFRVKNCQEAINKFNRKYRSDLEEKGVDYEIANYVTDLIGLRVICLYDDDIKKASEILRKNFDEIQPPTDKSSKLEEEKQFGYKGYHMDLKLKNPRLKLDEYKKYEHLSFEVQIRTIVQDAWSVIDHKIKYKKNIDITLERGIIRLAALFEIADQEFLRIRNETEHFLETAITDLDQSEKLQNEPLNVFTFSSIIYNKFGKYNLQGNKIDGFVEEIKWARPDISAGDILKATNENLELVTEYSKEKDIYMNPYTKLRYCLFLYDQKSFVNFIYPGQKRSFLQWISDSSNNLDK